MVYVARFQFFSPDRQTRQTTDRQTDCLTPLRTCARGVIMNVLNLGMYKSTFPTTPKFIFSAWGPLSDPCTSSGITFHTTHIPPCHCSYVSGIKHVQKSPMHIREVRCMESGVELKPFCVGMVPTSYSQSI